MSIRKIKEEIRILGWDDSPFSEEDERVPIVGSVVRGGKPYLDGVLVEDIAVDGFDATQKIAKASKNTKHRDQLRIIMLDGITFAGFNTVDIEKLHRETDLPVVVVTRKNIDFGKFKKAMEKLPGFKRRWKCIERAGDLKELSMPDGKLYFQNIGISEKKTKELLKMSTSNSLTPEPIRISHLIASGIKEGESIGGA